MNTRPPRVTSAPPRLFGDPRRSGSAIPFRRGWFRTEGSPSPSGTFHAISPLLRSSAVRTAYGGDVSGRPSTFASSPPRANLLEYGPSTSASDPSFLPIRFTPIPRVARTKRYPVSGSNAAPPQFAPPPCPGRCSVPATEGGVYNG